MESTNNKKAVLSVRNLCKSFGPRKILSEINFDVFEGEILGLLGPNGSGKTTTIKLALGLLNIDKGNIEICGYDVKKDFCNAMKNIGCIIENPEMYKNLTGRQNLMQYFRMYDNIDISRIDEVVSLVGLQNRIDEKISKYSLGMRQRLGIAQALLNDPKILLLDEPTNGLDPEGIKSMRDLLIDLAHNKGVAVLISSHMLSELESFCDKVCIINSGKTLGTKTMNEIKSFDNKDSFKFIIKVDDNNKAKDICEKENITYKAEPENKFELIYSEEDMQKLLILLIQNGVVVKSFMPVERSLEEAFITIIKDSGGSKI